MQAGCGTLMKATHWSELTVEAMLAYWLLWFVLPCGLEDGLNANVFPLAIMLGKERKVGSNPVVPGFSFRTS